MFEFAGSPVADRVRTDLRRVFRREWDRLALPGTWWDGSERVAIAQHARAARYGAEPPPSNLPDPAAEAAETVGARPATIRQEWVEKIGDAIGYPQYVEITGIASRLAAIDTVHDGLGAAHEALPSPEAGEPSRTEEPQARLGTAWVPMVGGASITQALTLVEQESLAQEDLHGPLYLTYEGMAMLDYVAGLSRAQMELVAARTSAIN
nr:hypothetical protein [Desulfuromonadales bacterium]